MSYIGNQPTSVAFLTDSFSGTGSQTVFTMSVAPATPSAALVSVSGVVQDPSTYAVSGTTLTFTGAPPSGTGNISVRYLGIPASSVATTAYRTVTELTATAGQTTFTPASYNVGFINVYRNGVLLGTADYTATNGTTVVMATACIVGELIVVEGFYVSSVLNAIPATPGAVTTTYIQTSPTLTTPTLASPTINGTYTAGTSLITTGTINAGGTNPFPSSAGPSSVTFSSIPSWVKKITVMFNGVSTSSTSNILIQLGAGSVTSSGYISYCLTFGSGTGSGASSTAGFLIRTSAASEISSGLYTIATSGSNAWSMQGMIGSSNNSNGFITSGGVTLGGTLDRVIITTVGGTDLFDAGSINILYE
jgi:hypothetical protein